MSRHTRVDAGDVVLALTELVGNSVQHGSTPVEVELATTGEKLLLRVSDSSEDLPRQREHHDLAAFEGGRGVLLVERLSARWGVRLNQGGGNTIWCEFAPQP